MPIFIDWHKAEEIAPDLRETVKRNIASGTPDAHGVIDRGVVLDREQRRMFCILEAPDEEAVRKHHHDAGIEVERIHRAEAIL